MAQTSSAFPRFRMRRLRRHDWSRRLVAENRLSASDLIWPLFIVEGENKRVPVPSMPGVERLSVDNAVAAAEEAASLGIPVIALFPQTEEQRKPMTGARRKIPTIWFAAPCAQSSGPCRRSA